MQSHLTLEVTFDDSDAKWSIGALSRWDGRIELARSNECSPFTTVADVEKWLLAMWTAWCAPTLGQDVSESLHDAYASTSP